jgi:2-polyprenyl-6-methoxyphenol hydroxylase-like FAD-dependent oxidoreductase
MTRQRDNSQKSRLRNWPRWLSEAVGGPVELFEPAWITVVRFGNHLAPTFRNGRALLAGDAAHSIAPLSGQGMNTGVQDSFDLGWKLAYVHKGWAPESLLDSYTAERRPVAKKLTDSKIGPAN